jgi:hypothetical protein
MFPVTCKLFVVTPVDTAAVDMTRPPVVIPLDATKLPMVASEANSEADDTLELAVSTAVPMELATSVPVLRAVCTALLIVAREANSEADDTLELAVSTAVATELAVSEPVLTVPDTRPPAVIPVVAVSVPVVTVVAYTVGEDTLV